MTIGRGKVVAAHFKNILNVRELTRDELARLAVKRTKVAPHVQKLRDSHHNVARLLAAGLRPFEVASRAGYSMPRIYTLQKDPSFISLVEYYRNLVNETFKENVDEWMQMAVSNGLKAERMVADRLDQADEEGVPLPVRDLLAISRDMADRTGRGKVSTNVNVNVDFASALEKAIDRSKRATVIDAEPIRRQV